MRISWSVAVVLACLCGTATLGQEVTGSIVGTVTDPTGSVVPGAVVTVTNVDRGSVIRTVTTEANGGYVASLLPIGRYSVKAEAKGFKTFVKSDVELHVNDKLTVSFSLEVGDVTDTVSVVADAVSVELQSATQSGLLTGTQVRELPLSNRHFAQVLALQPGVSSNISDSIYLGTTNPTGGNNIVGFSVNGARQSQNNWIIDGADNVDRGSNITIQQYPSIDAIEEIKVVRSPYSAEYGRAGGGQVSVITRSGTNDFHGSAYEFFRNDQLNANNWFNNANRVDRPPLRHNDFGYTIGGPVYLPKIYDGHNKTFFFFSQEFRRVITSNASNVQVPTLEERAGKFRNPVCVEIAANGTCAGTDTQIANINPAAQQYITDIYSKLPAPTDGNNLFVPLRGVFNARQEIVKIDHNFGGKLMLSGRFLHDSIPTTDPGGLFTNSFVPGVPTTETDSPGRSLVIRGTSTLSPTFLNEAGWAWSRGGIFSRPVGLISRANSPNIDPALPFPGNPDRVPTISFVGGLATLSSFGPYDNLSYNHTIFDNVTKVIGKHTLKFGGTINIYRKQENQLADNAGGFQFSNTPRPAANVTLQQAWANFLLGNVATFSQVSADLTADIRSKAFELYFQDDYRILSNLTLNIGLRYSNFRQPTEANGLLTNFDSAAYDPSRAFQIDPVSGNRIEGTGDPLNGIIQGGRNSPFGDTVARENNRDFAPRIGFAWDPMKDGKTAIRAGYGMFFDTVLVGIYQQNIGTNPTSSFTSISIPNTRFDNPAAGTPSVSLAPPALRGVDTNFSTPYVQQWSFDIQRQLPFDSIFTIGYVGSKGTNLIGIIDRDTLPAGFAAAAGFAPPTGYFNSANSPRLNFLRPFQGYRAINMIESSFNSNYHSLQASFQKRFGRNGLANVAYTWSKSITDNASDRSNAPQNAYNVQGDRGLSTLDRRHILTASYVYPLPFFKDRRNLTSYILGGWEILGTVTYNSGLPLTVTSALGNDPGGLGIIGPSSAGPRPDVIANPMVGPGLQTVSRWFNPAAFAEVPQGANRAGNVSRGIITAPGIVRWDMSLFKTVPIGEHVRLQLRGEAFNVLNHANFNAPVTALGNANFGRILGARDPRFLQIGAKLIF